jgi:signal transduction histidine kinase/CheY-like chemotaxis protein
MQETRQRETAELPLGDRWLQAVADPMLAEDGTLAGAVYILTDVTERKRLEEQVRQKQKMEAMGQLAGGIAHDFNNLLTAIIGNVSLLLAASPAEGPDREMLEAADRAAWRAAELTRQLLGLSRHTTSQLAPTHLQSCLEEVVSIVRRTIDPRIAVEVRGAPDLWTVQANPGQINQVVMNLCLNARDAMPEGGHLLLETENVVVGEAQARLSKDSRPGEFARLRVCDTGHGIPAEVLLRIFEPYFTTKEAGKGTGLGLATVYSIVQQHQGWIACSSEAGRGACFDVYLPRSNGGPAVTGAAPPLAAPLGSETILLADDDETLRSLGRAILSRYGYEVLLAEDGQQAVDVYRREKDRIALVILDLTMPRLSGRDALRQILAVSPRARVLLASGYIGEEGIDPGMEGALGLLTKPYTERDLAITVRRALDEGGPGGTPPPPEPRGPTSPTAPEPAQGGPSQAAGPEKGGEGGPSVWSSRSGLPKAQAEQLLAWLEAKGYQPRELTYEEGSGYTVRWQDEDLAARGRRCRRRFRQPCPECGSTRRPYMRREMAMLSWVLVACGVLIWPLLVVGLLLRVDVWRCWDCQHVLGQGRRLTLGW